MGIKETRHPPGMIDMTIIPYSRVATLSEKKKFHIPENHHVLIIDMGEYK